MNPSNRVLMDLQKYKAGSPEEEFEKALVELGAETRSRYRKFLMVFCEEMNTTPEGLYQFALDTFRSEKTADRLAIKKAWIGFYDGLLEKGVHKNTATNYKKAINKFLEANGLPKINGGTKSVQYRGQDRITPEEVERVIALPMSERMRAIILTLDQSGQRCSDVAQMKIEDFKKARKEYRNDKEFRTWRVPISSMKTGVNVPVCLGQEAIDAIKNYIKDRETGPIFLREKGMFHWTTNEEGERIKTDKRTEKGSPMSAKNITVAVRNLVKPLQAEGLRVSAHSFRKRFLDGWDQARKMNTGKFIVGKKIPQNDSAYLDIPRRYFEEYMDHYFKYISLDQKGKEIDAHRQRIEELESQLKEERSKNEESTKLTASLESLVKNLVERVEKLEVK